MKLGGLGTAGRDLRTLLEGGSTASLSDRELLARFTDRPGESRAEAAFEALVARHGPMVWGTCRRILRDPHAAEDAFQATFLILVKKARSVRVEDSLGRWLHGVGVRVALRARLDQARRGEREMAGVEPSVLPSEDGEIRALIDQEVERLPSNYRAVVVLCHLEGLTREHAASRLRCPVGTVNSRLSRASEILRARLTRRGLAPATGGLAVWLAGRDASAAVPARLVSSTVASAGKLGSGVSLAGMVPAGVLALVGSTLKGELMTKLMLAVGLLVGLVSVGSIGLAQQGKGEKDQAVAKVVSQTPAEKQIPASLEDRVKSLKAEWDAARDVYFKAMASAKTDAAKADVLKLDPDIVTYSRRFLTLAQTEIQNPAARDALLWILEQFWISDGFIGEWALIRDQAADLLIDFYGDDYRVARTALQMYRYLSPTRDRFLPALYEKAWSKPSKGAATLALAQYRWAESLSAFGRELVNQPVIRDDKGNIITMPAAMVAYHEMTYERDPAPLRAEAFRLLEEVIRDHSDESYDSRTGTTMGQKARDLFDEWANLSVGKPAPDFEGKTLEGQPVKLSDHRGKVVVLAFWASWCEPCVKQIAREKDIAARFKDRPFVIVGVNCDDDLEKAAKVAREQGMSWSSLFDRSKMTGPCEIDMGPVARLYHVNRLPSVLVLDGQGVIRHKLSGTQGLDQAVEELLNEPTKSSPAK